MSDIEGKAARAAASERGQRASFNEIRSSQEVTSPGCGYGLASE